MKEFIKHPLRVGAITPSSSFLADKMLENLQCSAADFVVELGPGTGAITKFILPRLPDKGQFLAVEINADMIKLLQKNYPNIQIAPISAGVLDQYLLTHNLPKTSYIISGLPWAIFSENLQNSILESVVKSMRPGSFFTTFAYVHALKLKPAKHFKEKLNSFFTTVQTTSPVWRNIPPAVVYHCKL